jgi:adenylosuccinate synthase
MRTLHIITDMQFGSTGKGLFAGYIAEMKDIDTIITAWGPNAGHTYVDWSGRKFVHTMLANGIVGAGVRMVLIGPGSVINPEALRAEIRGAIDVLEKHEIAILIHENAAVVTEEHRAAEREYGFKIGSTMKGTAQAMIQKLRRDPDHLNTAGAILRKDKFFAPMVVDSDVWIDLIKNRARNVLIEGAQGFSLSINHGFYPYTTSRDCTTAQLLVDCGIPMDFLVHSVPTVYGVCRTYPIRVANRFDANGNLIGTSGPHYRDQVETDWEALGVEPELTTVTKLVRRVFTISYHQLVKATQMNGVSFIFLNFANYVSQSQLEDMTAEINRQTGAIVRWHGFGPKVNDIRTVL